jgi:putative heme-binding domain-containing protein
MMLRGAYYSSFGKPDDGLGFGPDMVDHMYGSTAIAGLAEYLAPQYPAEYQHMMLVGNVVTNAINRCQLVPRGSAFHGEDRPDFLVSDDHWFRPTCIKLGPDGALYVADFYNRIIGHYEVDLHHPGRDHTSGRIWRIVYKGPDATPAPTKPFDLTRNSVPELIAYLSDPNFTIRMLAMNYLADHTGAPAIAPLRAALSSASCPSLLKVHGMWVLQRLGALDASMLKAFAADGDRDVRVHAMRVLAETSTWDDAQRELATAGLKDADPVVQRCAADAIGQHPAMENVRPLLDAREHAPKSDLHLIHVIRMALRNQLNDTGIADQLPPAGASEADVRNLVDVAVGATSPGAAMLVVKHLPADSESTESLARYVLHAARYGNDAQSEELAKVISTKFASDDGAQLTLFKAMEDGIAQRNGRLGPAARDWAGQLVARVIASPQEDFAGWVNQPTKEFPDAADPWSIELRPSADGNRSAPFISSRVLGEPGTGVLRSQDFALPAHFSFFFAGHSGAPNLANTKRDIIRIRESENHQVLVEVPAPRNDLAQRIDLDLTKFAGWRGYVEATDADNGTAYAWIAFGRFDPPVVKVPGSGLRPLRTAIEIAASLRLTNLAGQVASVLTDRSADAENRTAAAIALATLNPAGHASALIGALGDASTPMRARDAAGAALAQVPDAAARTALVEAIRTAPQKLQLSLAKSLAASAAGADALLEAIANGKASARLLLDPTLHERLNISKPADLDARMAKLTANLPAADQSLQRLIDRRVAQFSHANASPERGAKVFVTNCQVCHSIGGQGQHIGPQLDGIGVRGAPRLAEDILDPSRNVDAAFRYSTYLLDDGQAIAGIPRREEGQTLTVADSTGKEIAIPKSRIKRSVQSNQSLMPSNFGEIISQPDFNDLLSYLLSK